MIRATTSGHPAANGDRANERWVQNVQILTKGEAKDTPDWYIVVFADKSGQAGHSKLLILSSPVGSIIFGRTWTGRWKLTPWPDDLPRSQFAKLLMGHYTLAHYAESLDAALSGLSRKVTLGDVRRVEMRLRDAPWGAASWLALKLLLRNHPDPTLYRALEGYERAERAVLLPWLWPVATRSSRVRALQELEPAAVRLALLHSEHQHDTESATGVRNLFQAIDAREPLRIHACEMLALRSFQVRWLNQVAANPRTPSHFLADIWAVLAPLPPEIRPRTHAEMINKIADIKCASKHYQTLFSSELERRLPVTATASHRYAFQRSCIPLFKRTTPLPGRALKSRSFIYGWLQDLDDDCFMAAHFALCKMGFAKREQLFEEIAEWTFCPLLGLPLFVEEISKCAEEVWASLDVGGQGNSRSDTPCPQHWAAVYIHGTGQTTYFWPTTFAELKGTGRTFKNCLAGTGTHGRAYWLNVVSGHQMFAAITTRRGSVKAQSLVAFAVTKESGETFKIAVEQHYGLRNQPPPKLHISLAHRLQVRIVSELQESGLAQKMLYWQQELRTVADTAAGDASEWRSRQIDQSCRAAGLIK